MKGPDLIKLIEDADIGQDFTFFSEEEGDLDITGIIHTWKNEGEDERVARIV